MSAPKRPPLTAIDGFIIGFLLLGIALQTYQRDWDDLIDGVVFLALYWGWSSARRENEMLRAIVARNRWDR